MAGATRLVAAKDFRLRTRDRSFFVMAILAPLVLAFIFNAIFGSALQAEGFDMTFGLVDEDGSAASAGLEGLLEDLAAEEVLFLERFADGDEASAAVEGGDIQAYLLVPAGFGAAVEGTGSPTIEIVGDIDSQTATSIAAAIARQFGTGVDAARLAVVTSASILGVPPTADLVDRLETDPATAAFTSIMADVSAETRQLDGTTHLAAGMAIFFMFFTVQSGVIGLLEEQRDGTLQRLLAAPIRRAAVVGGKALLSFGLGVIALGVLVVASSLLMGAEWGHPLGVAVLTMAAVFSGVALMSVVAGVARSPEGAENMGSIIAVILGMLGGVFFPIGQGEGILSILTQATPHHWFLRGLGDLAGGAPWTAALPSAAVLVALGIVAGASGWMALNRRLER